MVDFTGVTAEIFSGVAVVVSGYSLWHTALRGAELRVFVPPLIRYASPYQNSIFEVFEIPLTVLNEGARTGTVLSLHLEVTDLQSGAAKHFYSAGLGPWILAKVRDEGTAPFSPIPLAGRASHAATVLFFPREDSQVRQIVESVGRYRFAIWAVTPQSGANGKAKPLVFDMVLPYLDHRAFTSGAGTIALHSPDWQTAGSQL